MRLKINKSRKDKPLADGDMVQIVTKGTRGKPENFVLKQHHVHPVIAFKNTYTPEEFVRALTVVEFGKLLSRVSKNEDAKTAFERFKIVGMDLNDNVDMEQFGILTSNGVLTAGRKNEIMG